MTANARFLRRILRRLAKGRDTYRYVPSAEAPLSRGPDRKRLIPAREFRPIGSDPDDWGQL